MNRLSPLSLAEPSKPFDASHYADIAAQLRTLAKGNEVVPPAIEAGVVAQSFRGVPRVTGATNWCGQAACASIIKAWARHGGQSDDDLMTDIYSRFPPDVFGGGLGTSPFRIVEILNAYGFRASWGEIGGWSAGGFLNPVNQPLWQWHRGNVEDRWVKAGFPVIVLVDAGMINGPEWMAHWIPLAMVSSTSATICDAFDSSGQYADLTMPLDRFHEAWEIRFLPMLHFVVCYPQPV